MTILRKPNVTWRLIAVLFVGVMTTTTNAATPKRPNVLYIMSDDHCAQAVGAYGGRLATLNPTPVIDKLAAEGILFESCFCTNSICSPSRACVITGQYNHTNGVYDLGGSVQPENQTLAIEMREAGYESGEEPADSKKVAYYRYWMHMAHHWNPGCVGVRTKEYKLIYYYGCSYTGTNQTPPGWELYDLVKDPAEVKNIYDNPAYADVAQQMKALLAKRCAEVGDDGQDYPACEAIVQEFWDYDEADREKAIQISHRYAESCQSGSGSQQPVRRPKVKRTKDGFIEPAESQAPLNELDRLKEISRSAVYKVSHPGPISFNPDLPYLLSGDGPKIKGQSFHSAGSVECPHIVMRLDEAKTVAKVVIMNRTTGCQERAAGLTLWLSTDGKAWKEVWQAEKVEQAWTVDLGEGEKAQYLKLGLPGKGTLHLNKVTVFGK